MYLRVRVPFAWLQPSGHPALYGSLLIIYIEDPNSCLTLDDERVNLLNESIKPSLKEKERWLSEAITEWFNFIFIFFV